MKRVFGRVIAAFCLGLGACSNQPSAIDENGTVRALAPVNSSEKGGYSFKTVELQGITDISSLSGKYADFILGPRVAENRLKGAKPHARFLRKSEGEYVPTQAMTQNMVALYWHMQNLAQLDAELGVPDINKWPRQIGLGTRSSSRAGNNAFYDSKTDSLIFLRYSYEDLSLALNAGVLAHEHFHSLFYKLVLKAPLASLHAETLEDHQAQQEEGAALAAHVGLAQSSFSEEELRYHTNRAWVRGLNEGLADFWGWMYTGNPDFVAQSLWVVRNGSRSLDANMLMGLRPLPSHKQTRMTLSRLVFESQDAHKGQGSHCRNLEQCARDYAYPLGTETARVMKRFTDIYAQSHQMKSSVARKEVAKLILKTLPLLKSEYSDMRKRELEPVSFLRIFAEQVKDMKSEECRLLSEIMTASTDNFEKKFECVEKNGWIVQEVENKPLATQGATL
ncbi:MAG: hypothetical protein AAGB31_00460 [Bdellovibrio sp.]